MKLYNDIEDQHLLTEGKEVYFLSSLGYVISGTFKELLPGGFCNLVTGSGAVQRHRTTDIEMIDDGSRNGKRFWYFLKSDLGEKLALRPDGFYMDGPDRKLAIAVRGTEEEGRNVAEKFGYPHVKEIDVGNNRREDFVPQKSEGDHMAEKKPCPDCGKEFTWLADGSRPREHKCVPKTEAPAEQQAAAAPAQPGTGPTVEQVIAAYITTRDQIEAEKKIFDEKVANLKKFQEARETWLAAQLDAAQCTSMKKNGVGTAFFKTQSSVTLGDSQQFTDWVMEDWSDRNHYLERRASKTAVVEAIEAGEAPPPGVNYTTRRVVQVQRG